MEKIEIFAHDIYKIQNAVKFIAEFHLNILHDEAEFYPDDETTLRLSDLGFHNVALHVSDDGFELSGKLYDERFEIEDELEVLDILKSETVTEFLYKTLKYI